MHVLLMGASAGSGRCGVSDYIRRLGDALTREGAVVTVVSAGEHAWPAHWRLSGLATVWRYLRDSDVDLLHVHYPSRDFGSYLLPWLVPVLARMTRLPTVVTLHEPVSLLRIYRLVPLLLSGAPLITVRPNLRELMSPLPRLLIAKRPLHYLRSASTLPVASPSPAQVTAVRRRLRCTGRLLVFFGFVYRAKGVHRLIDVPLQGGDVLAIAGEMPDQAYVQELEEAFHKRGMQERVRILGPLPASEASELIAAADALLLPFEGGGGDWNTSIHAGVQNGTFVVTTSTSRSGYDSKEDVFYAAPGDSSAIAGALEKRFGGEFVPQPKVGEEGGRWGQLARQHLTLYTRLDGVPV